MSYYLNIISSISRPSSPSPHPHTPDVDDDDQDQDKLARQSDVTVSNITAASHTTPRGFTTFILATLALATYVLWTLLPDAVLTQKLLVDYYPDKQWAVAFPAWSLMLMVFVYCGLALYNLEVLTLGLGDVRCVVDEASVFPDEVFDEPGGESTRLNQDDNREVGEGGGMRCVEYVHAAPSGVWDLPIGLVNEVLYTDNFKL
ncbi:Meiotically up-regulated gene 84 protein [Candida viswanathii]|uniref:Meiotically up-regulated gene 84 protein n=1 Tax=Candida viswanathii TaxID=5486 RepID=A0A367YNM3_9ASCO|nr:Meiotically up-regulated gene 84 protein [Candida viswanathii]